MKIFTDELTNLLTRPRRENRTSNGTLTLRRSSTNPAGTSHQASQSEAIANTPASELPPTQSQQFSSNGNEGQGDNRYDKDTMLDIWRTEQAKGSSNGDVSRLFVDNWDPGHSNGAPTRGWAKANDSNGNSYGPHVCWNESGSTVPIGIQEMTEDEKIVRTLTRLIITVYSNMPYSYLPATSIPL